MVLAANFTVQRFKPIDVRITYIMYAGSFLTRGRDGGK